MRIRPLPAVATLAAAVVGAAAAARAGEPPRFSGPRAMQHLEAICELGPRPSGSPAMTRQRALLVDFFRRAGGRVAGQAFEIRDRRTGAPVHIENLVVEWHPDRAERILLAAHFDTRPYPDRDPVDPKGVFLGANDGASGVAVLMELAAAMPALPGPVGVDFALFDAEEYVVGPRDPYCLGSTYFARQHAADRKAGRLAHRYRSAVVIDMVADKNLEIWQEQNSVARPESRALVDSIWAVARRLQARAFVPRPKYAIEDDHLPLQRIAGIPACDVIDLDFPQWHTTADTPAHCAAESLETVGSVVLEWLREQR